MSFVRGPWHVRGIIRVEAEEVKLLMTEMRGLEASVQGETLHPLAVQLTLAKVEAFIELVSQRERRVKQLRHRLLLAALLGQARDWRDRLRGMVREGD